MASETGSKINQLLKKWPSGSVAVLPWLERQGAYQQLVHEYIKTSWLRGWAREPMPGRRQGRVDRWSLCHPGADWGSPYTRAEKPRFKCRGMPISCRWGKASTVSLFGLPNVKLPAWFKEYRWEVKIRYTATNLFAGEENQGLTKRELGSYSVTVASPERAMMEVLYLAPHQESYEEAKLLMEGLTTLRPRLVQALLERCNSVKVKRLFMVLAESFQHAWVKKLDLSKVDFGKGKRMLVRGWAVRFQIQHHRAGYEAT